MILGCSFSSDSSPLEKAGTKHRFFGCNTSVFAGVRALIGDANPFSQGKNLSNNRDSRAPPAAAKWRQKWRHSDDQSRAFAASS